MWLLRTFCSVQTQQKSGSSSPPLKNSYCVSAVCSLPAWWGAGGTGQQGGTGWGAGPFGSFRPSHQVGPPHRQPPLWPGSREPEKGVEQRRASTLCPAVGMGWGNQGAHRGLTCHTGFLTSVLVLWSHRRMPLGGGNTHSHIWGCFCGVFPSDYCQACLLSY